MARKTAPPTLTRRKALTWLAATPAVAALGGSALAQMEEIEEFANLDKLADSKDDKELKKAAKAATADARCIADNEDLSRREKKALLKKMQGLEGALKTLREFESAGEVEPAFSFRAMRAAGRRR